MSDNFQSMPTAPKDRPIMAVCGGLQVLVSWSDAQRAWVVDGTDIGFNAWDAPKAWHPATTSEIADPLGAFEARYL